MKKYQAPQLFIDEYVADTMIASGGGGGGPKNDNAGNNQNCWGCNQVFAKVEDGENACMGPGYPGC